MTRSRVASAAAVLLLAWAALLVPNALAQTPSPSPSPSPSSSPSDAAGASPSPVTSSPSATPETESLAVLLSAEPDTIEAGAETVLVAQVTNTGSGVVEGATLEVTLPAQLEFVSAFPAPASRAEGTHTFDLGSLGPNESAVVQLTARGIDVVEAATVTATANAGGAVASDAVDVMVIVTAGGGGGGPDGLVVSSRADDVLSQVGSMVRYVVTVTNEGDEDLENVLVVDLAPEEIEVVSVDIVDEVEAAQIGESEGRYDVVWNVGSLPAGASVELPWDGKAIRPGDLTAVNSVRGLLGQTETVRAESRSFLADEGPRDVENPRFEPIEKRVVTFVDPPPPPQPPQARAETTPTVVLPYTGASSSRLAFAGLMLVAAGLLVLGGTRLASGASGRAFAGAVLAGLVLVACVDGGDGGSSDQAAPSASASSDARVKGERIVRGGGDEDEATAAPTASPKNTPAPTAPPAATPAPPVTSEPPVVAAPTAPPAPAPATPAPDPEPIRVVDVVRIGLGDLPVEPLASRDGDNTVSFAWDESAGVTAATSGRRFSPGAGSELLTNLSTEDGAIVNRLTLRNTNDDVRLEVKGRLVHEVYSGGRLVARLRSAPIDVVLSPGGSVVARFSYLVPTGDYDVHATFESSQ